MRWGLRIERILMRRRMRFEVLNPLSSTKKKTNTKAIAPKHMFRSVLLQDFYSISHKHT
jgi:hypothetical protein